VFGTGDMFRTGNAAGPGTLEEQWAAGQAQKVSMGPAQSDIARIIQGSQGTLGIATWTTIKLELMPTLRRGFIVGGNTLDELIPFAYKMLWRKLPDVCLILNSTDLAGIYGHDSKDLPAWALVYSISGLEHLPEERLEFMEKDIADMAQAFNVTPTQYVVDISADKLIDIITGPSDEPYWKSRPMGACQDLFFLTTLDRTPEFIKAIESETQAHGFSKEATGIYIQPIRHGTGCHIEVNLFYDAKDPEESQKVRTLLDSAGKTCLDMGGFFSRPHGTWTDMVYSKCPDTVRALRKLKDIFDPKGVMNPDKLCFGKEV
ncbi:MAG: FAD-binding oxidoreductase, partial [Desulfobacterales bacterium]|nr:FAD-binding oxidoreductase [Desulfobacterales bacterium]